MNEELEQLKIQVEELRQQYHLHKHTGDDLSEDISFVNEFCVHWTTGYQVVWSGATYNMSDQIGGSIPCFIAPFACTIKAVKTYYHSSSSGGSLTLALRKQTSTQSGNAGVDCLASSVSSSNAGPRTDTPTLTSTTANLTLAAGDHLTWYKDSDTGVTGFPNFSSTIHFEKV